MCRPIRTKFKSKLLCRTAFYSLDPLMTLNKSLFVCSDVYVEAGVGTYSCSESAAGADQFPTVLPCHHSGC